jgi:hypothetical protein
MKFKLVKIFDCEDMPPNVKEEFLDSSSKEIYCSYYVDDDKNDIVSIWLLDNGASLNERVMIKRWW